MNKTAATSSAAGPWLGSVPWWLVSAGIHAVVLLGAAIVYLERTWAVDTGPLIVDFSGPRVAPLPAPNRPGSPDARPHRTADPGPEPPEDARPLAWPAEDGSTVCAGEPGLSNIPLRWGESANSVGECSGGPEHSTGRSSGPGASLIPALGTGAGAGFKGRRGPSGGGGHPGLADNGGDPATERGVQAALDWLARHQNADGSWSAAGFGRHCGAGLCSGKGEADFDTGVTALSLLAFLGAGYTQVSRDAVPDPRGPGRELHFGQVVKQGLLWLSLHQDPEGSVGERGPKHLYGHALAALALSEAYGMTEAPVLRDPAQRAIDFLVAAQNPGKGWRYQPRSGDNDSSVTGWAVMALKSAELSGLSFPPSAFRGALAWFDEATEPGGYFRVGYTRAGTGKVFVPGVNESFGDHPSMSAVAVISRIFIEKRHGPSLGSVHLLAGDLPSWTKGQVDFYYWYYGSLALFQYDGPRGPFWRRWNERMKNAIVPHQKAAASGCDAGSWDPSEDRWGAEGGRVYAAAINCLSLEVYYRYAHVFGGPGR